MSTSPSIIDTRRHQMFPVLETFEIERVRRFGKIRPYDDAAALAKVGEVGPGLTIVLAGQVEIVRRDELGKQHTDRDVLAQGRSWGSLLNSLAGQLSLMPTRHGSPDEVGPADQFGSEGLRNLDDNAA